MLSIGFRLWLEFEEFTNVERPVLYFNMKIYLADGREYALNVWVVSHIEAILAEDAASRDSVDAQYAVGPDLLVRRADRSLLEQVVADLVATNRLEERWRVSG